MCPHPSRHSGWSGSLALWKRFGWCASSASWWRWGCSSPRFCIRWNPCFGPWCYWFFGWSEKTTYFCWFFFLKYHLHPDSSAWTLPCPCCSNTQWIETPCCRWRMETHPSLAARRARADVVAWCHQLYIPGSRYHIFARLPAICVVYSLVLWHHMHVSTGLPISCRMKWNHLHLRCWLFMPLLYFWHKWWMTMWLTSRAPLSRVKMRWPWRNILGRYRTRCCSLFICRASFFQCMLFCPFLFGRDCLGNRRLFVRCTCNQKDPKSQNAQVHWYLHCACVLCVHCMYICMVHGTHVIMILTVIQLCCVHAVMQKAGFCSHTWCQKLREIQIWYSHEPFRTPWVCSEHMPSSQPSPVMPFGLVRFGGCNMSHRFGGVVIVVSRIQWCTFLSFLTKLRMFAFAWSSTLDGTLKTSHWQCTWCELKGLGVSFASFNDNPLFGGSPLKRSVWTKKPLDPKQSNPSWPNLRTLFMSISAGVSWEHVLSPLKSISLVWVPRCSWKPSKSCNFSGDFRSGCHCHSNWGDFLETWAMHQSNSWGLCLFVFHRLYLFCRGWPSWAKGIKQMGRPRMIDATVIFEVTPLNFDVITEELRINHHCTSEVLNVVTGVFCQSASWICLVFFHSLLSILFFKPFCFEQLVNVHPPQTTFSPLLFPQKAIDSAQNDHAAIVQSILENKDFLFSVWDVRNRWCAWSQLWWLKRIITRKRTLPRSRPCFPSSVEVEVEVETEPRISSPFRCLKRRSTRQRSGITLNLWD